MRAIGNILLLLFGLLIGAFMVGGVRAFAGVIGAVSLPSLAIVITLFTLAPDRTLALAAGIGLGLDALGGYPFPSWTIIMVLAASGGVWIARAFLTNRSLFALVLLGIVMRAILLALTGAVSWTAALIVSSPLAFRPDGAWALANVQAVSIELILLIIFFMGYAKRGGRMSGTLAHVPGRSI